MSDRPTILVCDDEELIRWSLHAHLEAEGYDVVEAEDGQDCLEKIADTPPDLVLSDVRMPRMDGIEMLRRLRTQYADLPVIVLTAFGTLATASEALKLGATRCMTKPFELQEISAAVHAALEGQPARAR